MLTAVATINLKNCPFCAGKVKLFTDDYVSQVDTYTAGYHIICQSCQADIEFSDKTEDEVVSLWNRTGGYPRYKKY
jgi:Fe2+ or Zn2+ uptake regulation protein